MRSTSSPSSASAVTAPDEEGVHHRPGRVVGVHVQRVEVEPLRLDLGPLGDLVAHGHEVVLDALLDGGQRVPGAGRAAVVGQRDVDGLVDQHGLVALRLELGAAAIVLAADQPAGPVRRAGRPRNGRPAGAQRSRGWPGRAGCGRRRGRRTRRAARPGPWPRRSRSAPRRPRRRRSPATGPPPVWGRTDRWPRTWAASLQAQIVVDVGSSLTTAPARFVVAIDAIQRVDRRPQTAQVFRPRT